MKHRAARWLKFGLRWGIAVAGIWWVVANMSWRDHVLVLNGINRPVRAVLLSEQGGEYRIANPANHGQIEVVNRSQLVSEPDQKWLEVNVGGQTQMVELLGVDLAGDLNRNPQVVKLLVNDAKTGRGRWILPSEVVGGFHLKVPHPLVEVGVVSMVKGADPRMLIAALAVFPFTFIITTLRWHALLNVLGIQLRIGRTFVLNMVGAFYNTFMPGSTGGDVLKAIYASRQTTHKTWAVVSVVVDRAIGLIALVVMGGVMAGLRYFLTRTIPDPATRACRNVSLVSLAMIGGGVIGLVVVFNARARELFGVNYLLRQLPMQQQVQKSIEAMAMYRQRLGLIFWAMVVSFPVHLTVVVSAMLAGWAFGLRLTPGYYFVAVPVIVLVGSIPVSPQGAGVMEFFAILLLARQGATVSQAFALTMSIRMVQVLWNLTGGIFVLIGGYHAPTELEKRELKEGEPVAARS